MKKFYLLPIISILFFSTASAQNVGIGVVSPQEKLHIDGFLRGNQNGAVRVSTGNGYIDIGPKNTSWSHFETDRARFYFNKGITVNGGLVGSHVGDDLSLQTNGTTRISILNSNGNVGIGGINPSSKLQIYNGSLRLPGTSYEGAGQIQSPDIVRFADGSSAQAVYAKQISVSDSWSNNDTYSQTDGIYSKGNLRVGGSMLALFANTSTGNVGIGTSSPTSANYGTGGRVLDLRESDDGEIAQLTVAGSGQGTGYIFVGQSDSYGGGITYNGDNTPAMPNISTDDISIFRRSAGTDYEVLHWSHNSSTAEFEGDIDMNNNKVTNMASPTAAADGATKAYVDAQVGAVTETDPTWSGSANTTATVSRTGNVSVGDLTVTGDDIYSSTNVRLNANGYIDFRPSDSQHGLIIRDFDGSSTSWSGIRTVNSDRMEFRMDGGSYGGSLVVKSNDNVGIGTTSPGYKLDVVGDIRARDRVYVGTGGGSFYNDSGSRIRIDQDFYTNNSNTYLYGDNTYLGSSSGDNVLLRGNQLTWNSGKLNTSGNLGLGTSSPSERLDVDGQVRIRGGSPAAGKVLVSDANGVATWEKAGKGEFNSGSVTAGNWYRIASNSGNRANAEFTLRDYISGGGHSTLKFQAGISFGDAGKMSFTMTSHSIYGTPTFTQVRILENGTYDNMYLEVYCARSGSVDYSIVDNLQGSGWTPVDWTAGSVPSGYAVRNYTVDNLFVIGDYQNRFTVSRGGNATLEGRFRSNGINETSDERFKKDITPLESSLENLMQMRGVNYYWKKDEFPTKGFSDGKEIGVIAQEVEKIYPELVVTDKDGYKSVQYSHLVPVLIEAIKEQQTIIQSQKSEVNELSAELSKQSEISKDQEARLKYLEEVLLQQSKK